MALTGDENKVARNTFRELWRERLGDYYADSILVDETNKMVAINCGGTVTVARLCEWHGVMLAARADDHWPSFREIIDRIQERQRALDAAAEARGEPDWIERAESEAVKTEHDA
jgi:hypothetical protein